MGKRKEVGKAGGGGKEGGGAAEGAAAASGVGKEEEKGARAMPVFPATAEEAERMTAGSTAPAGWRFRKYDEAGLSSRLEEMRAEVDAASRTWRRAARRLQLKNDALENFYYNFEPLLGRSVGAGAVREALRQSSSRLPRGGVEEEAPGTPADPSTLTTLRPEGSGRPLSALQLLALVWGSAAMLVSLVGLAAGFLGSGRVPGGAAWVRGWLPGTVYAGDVQAVLMASSANAVWLIPALRGVLGLVARLLGDDPRLVDFGLVLLGDVHCALLTMGTALPVALRFVSKPPMTQGGAVLALAGVAVAALLQAYALYCKVVADAAWHVVEHPASSDVDRLAATRAVHKLGCVGRAFASFTALAAFQGMLHAAAMGMHAASGAESPQLQAFVLAVMPRVRALLGPLLPQV
jgi:hypothetical protein